MERIMIMLLIKKKNAEIMKVLLLKEEELKSNIIKQGKDHQVIDIIIINYSYLILFNNIY